ncbi:hypothetical protein BN1708_017582, partial [Verticillium longisporum]
MNEYRVPELNVQNGVLKSLSFLFEYIGEMAKDYVYAVTPLLEDALIDRDQVHRQTAASVVKHIALGVVGLGCEDAMIHLLNLLYPNLFETSPHVIDRIVEAIEAVRMAVGPGVVMNYVWAGLFHPARKVRQPYWRLYNDAWPRSTGKMLLLDYQNVLIQSVLTERFSGAPPAHIDQTVSDFDGVIYHISTPETKTQILLSVHIRCFKDLVQYGAEQVLQREYEQFVVAPEAGYDFSV